MEDNFMLHKTSVLVGITALFCLTAITCKKNPASPIIPSISGTSWAGSDVDNAYFAYSFASDGILHYASPTGSYANGTWTQNGDSVYMETNKKYSERTGTIQGNSMSGVGWNQVGKHWTWSLTKQIEFLNIP
jgi:hypothetical protein